MVPRPFLARHYYAQGLGLFDPWVAPFNLLEMISDFEFINGELAQKKKDTAQEKAEEEQPGCGREINGSAESISYEEAIQRELEYQKWIKKRTLPHSASSELPPSSQISMILDDMLILDVAFCLRQDLPSEPNLIVTRREAVSLPLPQKLLPAPQFQDQQAQPIHQQFHSQHHPPPRHDRQAPPQRLQFKKPSLHQLRHVGPLLQPPYQKTSQQLRLQHRQTFPQAQQQSQDWQHPPKKQLLDQQPQRSKAQQPFSSRTVPLWCDVRKVPCMTAFHLEQHQLGKKHKAKWEEVLGDKNTGKKRPLWCNECSIPCMDEAAMAQHCVGKRHAARLLVIKAEQFERERMAKASRGIRDMGLGVCS
ncbi:cell wall transcription factor ACE2 [Cocos nucifera]|uniref:Cell wall transcription factor ACE2 n=1 Tax=Cocos nucifera TaxID=13894 RepID=A0A8K0IGU6_COCNU|nr:cell wall transcription factor ACE2 [Cocos nucifera]